MSKVRSAGSRSVTPFGRTTVADSVAPSRVLMRTSSLMSYSASSFGAAGCGCCAASVPASNAATSNPCDRLTRTLARDRRRFLLRRDGALTEARNPDLAQRHRFGGAERARLEAPLEPQPIQQCG